MSSQCRLPYLTYNAYILYAVVPWAKNYGYMHATILLLLLLVELNWYFHYSIVFIE